MVETTPLTTLRHRFIVNTLMNYGGADLDAIFGALANADRRQMIDLLSLQPASIQQLANRVGMSLPAIDRHITVLEQSGLVHRKKSGRTNFLALDRGTMREFQAWAWEVRRRVGNRRRDPGERRGRHPRCRSHTRNEESEIAMKKFLFLYKGYMPPTPEIGKAWMDWFGTVGDAMVDSGNPMSGGVEVTPDEVKTHPGPAWSHSPAIRSSTPTPWTDAIMLAKTNPMITSVVVYDLARM